MIIKDIKHITFDGMFENRSEFGTIIRIQINKKFKEYLAFSYDSYIYNWPLGTRLSKKQSEKILLLLKTYSIQKAACKIGV